MNETRTEYRVVCAGYNTPGHHEHLYVKGSLELCEKYAKQLDKRTKGRAREFEIPFDVQTRVVSDWEFVEEGNDE